jgi:hypothetical protein
MRRFLQLVTLAVLTCHTAGCLLPAYSGEPRRRARQLLYTSENLRMLLDDWERIWFLDQPDHMTPFRTHGGVL